MGDMQNCGGWNMPNIPGRSVCYANFQQVSSVYVQIESFLFLGLGQHLGGW